MVNSLDCPELQHFPSPAIYGGEIKKNIMFPAMNGGAWEEI
jgi:hypothetical protein